MEKGDLIVPVYLNQRMVFDLLAMREDGISHVTRVASTERSGSADREGYGAELGMGKVFSSFLKVRVSGDRAKAKESGASSLIDEERVHTPASLFYRLRNQLIDDGILVGLEGDLSSKIHRFVEFEAELRRNPLLDAINSISSLLNEESEGKPRKEGQRRVPDRERSSERTRPLSERLRGCDSVEMVAYDVEGGANALITLEIGYLNSPSMADVIDGRFKVMGKVIRTVGYGESFSLLRKTLFSIVPQDELEQVLRAFDVLSKKDRYDFASVGREMRGPAFQVLPIAIFA
ncbi:DUF6414 family protein [Thioalkalivibrio sp. HK1]|uniref:DUF6414 family protein n=1 Tax=Thioalkalivibrio sp. HK1 TaxID=1469245 RepID=UPI00047123BD|nr:hypothetical protein [Thioalkalivibrio sp. HK1]